MSQAEAVRTSRKAADIKQAFSNHLRYDLAVTESTATLHDRYLALAWAVRDRLIDRWIRTQEYYYQRNAKRVYYLSLEFLIGRSLANNIINLEMEQGVREAMHELGTEFEELREEEVDAGLGNGGLGRLAACYVESMATLGIAGYGYSLRYEHGIFQQTIKDGFQVEQPDSWLRGGNPWDIARPDRAVSVHFGGEVEQYQHEGQLIVLWKPVETIFGIPYDMPMVGYGGKTVNTLRLWQAVAPDDFDFEDFNRGDYLGAVDSKVLAENLTKVLYPSDDTAAGKELRFKQQYFFVACSVSDILRRFRKSKHNGWTDLPNHVAMQLNDTHPTLAIPELMRILIDQEHVEWDLAWDIVQKTTAYTNHTLLSEALETWPVDMMARLLPRHYQIICEINHRFLRKVSAFFPGDHDRRRDLSIIAEGDWPRVRMAHLAIVGSHTVNGVAELHTELIKSQLVPDFARMNPKKFKNVTNGVTPRRWLLKANPPLAAAITEAIGDKWITELDELEKLRPLADDASFRAKFEDSKQEAKIKLIDYLVHHHGIAINPDMRFDVHCKRIHTYKRQLLNCLHIAHLYAKLRRGELPDFVPTAFIFSGKAAPGFHLAKMIIKLINDMAGIINQDPLVSDKLNVYFLPNYRVSLAERLIPAADVSEQISMAGTEASGTGNMKFMMNGALTIGTLDGANIEIVEQAGRDNAFIFGLTAEEVNESRHYYSPGWHYDNEPMVREVVDMVFVDRVFNPDHPYIYDTIQSFLFEHGDPYMHFADFAAYAEAHEKIQALYHDTEGWSRRAILNIAASGKFSSDRSIADYAQKIWHVRPCLPNNGD